MQSETIVRLIRPIDVDPINDFCNVAFTEGGYSYDIRGEMCRAIAAEFYKDEFYATIIDEKPVAVCNISQVGFSDSVYGISAVYVHPDYRGKGIGSELIKFVLDIMQKRPIDTVLLSTRRVSFFSRLGFEVTNIPRNDWSLMFKKINEID